MKQRNIYYNSTFDRMIDTFVYSLSIVIIAVTLYPVLYTVALSFSNRIAVESGQVWLYPVNITFASYLLVFRHPLIIPAYFNTIFYTVAGTTYSLFLTAMGGYVLSRRDLIGRNFFTFLITFTMLFSGGLIPTFLVVSRLGLYDTIWAILLTGAISQWNLIIVRTSMKAIPTSLEESAKIDGASHWQVFTRIYIPLSKPVLATIGLFYAVGRWNDFFTALIYLNRSKLFPVQLVIRGLLTGMDTMNVEQSMVGGGVGSFTPTTFKAAVVVVTMLPIMCVYPFIQKYFVKGVMIGAIKG